MVPKLDIYNGDALPEDKEGAERGVGRGTFSQVDPERRRSTRERLLFTPEEVQRLYGAIISGLKNFL
jgi:hypothetical protein